jgi:hypothetical protein
MTVEDCLQEYETMAGAIFGRPRPFHKMNTIVVKRNKYSRKPLEKAIHEVIERRLELRDEDDPKPLFQTEIDTCRGSVWPPHTCPVTYFADVLPALFLQCKYVTAVLFKTGFSLGHTLPTLRRVVEMLEVVGLLL